MSDILSHYVEAGCEAARLGAGVLEKWRARFQVREKGRFDLVTDADLESQQVIEQYLMERFPEHQFLGEEDVEKKGHPGRESPPTWIVDPLDGTTNYVHDCPMYCVSIGLYAEGRLTVGVIYDPSRDEMFSGARGQGAWLGEQRLQVSDTSELSQALLGAGFPPDLRHHEQVLEWWSRFSLRTRSLRRTGSTALNLAYVAAGRFDGFWAFNNHVWDVAGGALLIEEAGGVITNMDGSHYNPFTPDSVASNGILQEELLAILGASQ